MANALASRGSSSRRQAGFSLVDVLISLSIIGIILTSMTAFFKSQMTGQKYLAQKYEPLDLKQSLLMMMSSQTWATTCGCQLDPLDATNPNNVKSNLYFNRDVIDGSQSLNLNGIYGSCGAAAPQIKPGDLVPGTSTGLRIDTIKLNNLMPVGNPAQNLWTGTWTISFKSSGNSAALAPIQISQLINLPDSPANYTLTCQGTGGLLSGGSNSLAMMCPSNQVMVGFGASGAICTPLNSSAINTSVGPSSPGNGCQGTSCRTYDFGPCTGVSCFTNGSYCSGTSCIACAAGATCSGVNCCSGPTCGGCATTAQAGYRGSSSGTAKGGSWLGSSSWSW